MTISASPLLTIVIPTANRPNYLHKVVGKIREIIPGPELQLIVSDNSDNPDLKSTLSLEIESGAIEYYYLDIPASVVDNFEFSLQFVRGDYAMYIGDDDCIGPDLIQIVNWAKEHSADALLSYRSEFLANYFWPGVAHKYSISTYEEKLFVNKFSGEITPLNSLQELRNTADYPGFGVLGMPRIYQGIVSKELICRIVDKYGHLFGGVSPDIYSAALISYESKNSFVVDYPFVIPGGSAPSTAGMGAARTDVSDLYKFDHIRRFGPQFRWDKRIPEFYSSTNVWAFSLLKAVEAINDDGLTLNFNRLYSHAWFLHSAYRSNVRSAMRAKCSNVADNLKFSAYVLHEGILQIKRVWRKLTRHQTVFSGIHDIGAAYEALNSEISRRKISINFDSTR